MEREEMPQPEGEALNLQEGQQGGRQHQRAAWNSVYRVQAMGVARPNQDRMDVVISRP